MYSWDTNNEKHCLYPFTLKNQKHLLLCMKRAIKMKLSRQKYEIKRVKTLNTDTILSNDSKRWVGDSGTHQVSKDEFLIWIMGLSVSQKSYTHK